MKQWTIPQDGNLNDITSTGEQNTIHAVHEGLVVLRVAIEQDRHDTSTRTFHRLDITGNDKAFLLFVVLKVPKILLSCCRPKLERVGPTRKRQTCDKMPTTGLLLSGERTASVWMTKAHT